MAHRVYKDKVKDKMELKVEGGAECGLLLYGRAERLAVLPAKKKKAKRNNGLECSAV